MLVRKGKVVAQVLVIGMLVPFISVDSMARFKPAQSKWVQKLISSENISLGSCKSKGSSLLKPYSRLSQPLALLGKSHPAAVPAALSKVAAFLIKRDKEIVLAKAEDSNESLIEELTQELLSGIKACPSIQRVNHLKMGGKVPLVQQNHAACWDQESAIAHRNLGREVREIFSAQVLADITQMPNQRKSDLAEKLADYFIAQVREDYLGKSEQEALDPIDQELLKEARKNALPFFEKNVRLLLENLPEEKLTKNRQLIMAELRKVSNKAYAQFVEQHAPKSIAENNRDADLLMKDLAKSVVTEAITSKANKKFYHGKYIDSPLKKLKTAFFCESLRLADQGKTPHEKDRNLKRMLLGITADSSGPSLDVEESIRTEPLKVTVLMAAGKEKDFDFFQIQIDQIKRGKATVFSDPSVLKKAYAQATKKKDESTAHQISLLMDASAQSQMDALADQKASELSFRRLSSFANSFGPVHAVVAFARSKWTDPKVLKAGLEKSKGASSERKVDEDAKKLVEYTRDVYKEIKEEIANQANSGSPKALDNPATAAAHILVAMENEGKTSHKVRIGDVVLQAFYSPKEGRGIVRVLESGASDLMDHEAIERAHELEAVLIEKLNSRQIRIGMDQTPLVFGEVVPIDVVRRKARTDSIH